MHSLKHNDFLLPYKRHENFNQTEQWQCLAAVMNILAKFNHDSTVKPVIVSFSGRKFMKIIGRCRVQFQWLVTGGPGGQLCGGGLLIKISIINIILMLVCSHFLIANKYFMDSLVSNKWTKYFTLPAIPCSPSHSSGSHQNQFSISAQCLLTGGILENHEEAQNNKLH